MKKAILFLVLLLTIGITINAQVLQTAKQKKQIEKYIDRSIFSNIYHQTLYFVKHVATTYIIGGVVVDKVPYDLYKDINTGDYYIVDEPLVR